MRKHIKRTVMTRNTNMRGSINKNRATIKQTKVRRGNEK